MVPYRSFLRLLPLALVAALALPGGAAHCAGTPTVTAAAVVTPPQPNWAELSPEQQRILAPLGKDWDQMEYFRRKKWLGIAARYTRLSPDEQKRVQERMEEWVRMSPEQRRTVREKYQTLNQLPPEKKEAVKLKWQEYSQMPDEEKHRLREAGKARSGGAKSALPTTGATGTTASPGSNVPAGSAGGAATPPAGTSGVESTPAPAGTGSK